MILTTTITLWYKYRRCEFPRQQANHTTPLMTTPAGKLISFSDAAKMLPGRNGGHVSVKSLLRWASPGRAGRPVLATFDLPGYRCTSAEAVHQFLRDMTAFKQRKHVLPTPQRLIRKRLKEYGL